MPHPSTIKTSNEAPYKSFADRMAEWILKYRLRHPSQPYLQKDAAVDMEVSPTAFSRIVRGRERPSPEQCLAIARYFGVEVEDVLLAAGYPDLASLRQWVESDTRPRDAEERQKILAVLAIALGMEDWQAEAARQWRATPWQKSTYKDTAEWALASSGDPYIRAKLYAQAVYDWGHSKKPNETWGERNTEELPFLVSQRKVSGGGR